MKKKDIQYRTRLVIGIISLINLSSCADTSSRLGINATCRTQETQTTKLGSNTSEEPVIDNTPNQNYQQEASNPQRASSFYWAIGGAFSTAERFAGTIRELGAAAVRSIQANQYILEGAVLGATVGHLINVSINNHLNERGGYTDFCPGQSLLFHSEL